MSRKVVRENVANWISSAQITTLNQVFTFKIRSQNVLNVTVTIDYRFEYIYNVDDGMGGVIGVFHTYDDYAYNTTQTLTASINLANYVPDMKIADFFSGVLKEFNLTCYGIEENVWQIEPLEDWYDKGTIYDITHYTTQENIDIERIKLYKRISFEYQKCESFMNRQYYNFFEIEYF